MPVHHYRPHPWHGLPAGLAFPDRLNAYIEITPFDSVKYEVDKESGFLMVDRPQRLSSLPPTLYGFVPRTYCGPRVAALAGTEKGDGDPLDICVLSERAITRADILLRARPLGGLLMVDKGEADDKIVAVIEQDPVWGDVRELSELPPALIERLRHYFTTYKMTPGGNQVAIDAAYGIERAREVLLASAADYAEAFEETGLGPGARQPREAIAASRVSCSPSRPSTASRTRGPSPPTTSATLSSLAASSALRAKVGFVLSAAVHEMASTAPRAERPSEARLTSTGGAPCARAASTAPRSGWGVETDVTSAETALASAGSSPSTQ
jgi:inorganic pyrophosphatase